MADLTPDKILLTFLDKYGIGSYVTINPILLEIFPECTSVRSFSQQQIVGKKVIDLLQSLVKEGLIDIQNDEHLRLLTGNTREYFTVKNHRIRATLLTKGVSLLHQTQPATQIIVEGNHNTLAHQSPSAFAGSEFYSYQYPASGGQNKVSPEKKKVRSLVEMIAWLTGIAVSMIVISQTFFHTSEANKKPVNRIDSIRGLVKDSLAAKHGSPARARSASTLPYHNPIRHKPSPVPTKSDSTNNNSQMATQVKAPASINPPKEQKAINQEDVNNLPLKAVQRHIDLFDIRDLQSRISNKRSAITIFCGNNKECKVYAAEIRKSLDSMGYAVEPRIVFGSADNKAVRRFEVVGNPGWIWIKVYPQYQY